MLLRGLPGGIAGMFRALGEPAPERVVPSPPGPADVAPSRPGPADVARMQAVSRQCGVEILSRPVAPA